MVTSTQQRQSPPVKGSWEAVLTEAQRLARSNRPEAEARFRLIIDRALRLPKEQREARDGRIQNVVDRALFNLRSFLSEKNRVEEAVDLYADRLDELLDPVARSVWQEHQATLLSWLGRMDEAITIFEEQLELYPADIELFWKLFEVYRKQGDEAGMESVIAKVEEALERLQRGEQLGDEEEIEDGRLEGTAAYLRSMLALERHAWQEAFDAFAEAASSYEPYAQRWNSLYWYLVLAGETKLANRALNRDSSPVRQGFWRGYLGYRQGDEQGARTEWQQVVRRPVDDLYISEVFDWIWAQYFLGDKDRNGLEVALRIVEIPQQGRDPVALALAGVGWALQGRPERMVANLDLAVSLLRRGFIDNKLADTLGARLKDLLPDAYEQAASYFHPLRAGLSL